MNAFQAKGAMALLAIKVGMEVVYFTITVIAANSIFQRARTVIYGMDEVMSQKQGDGTIDGRLVYGCLLYTSDAADE